MTSSIGRSRAGRVVSEAIDACELADDGSVVFLEAAAFSMERCSVIKKCRGKRFPAVRSAFPPDARPIS
jgi:hypothetical protein